MQQDQEIEDEFDEECESSCQKLKMFSADVHRNRWLNARVDPDTDNTEEGLNMPSTLYQIQKQQEKALSEESQTQYQEQADETEEEYWTMDPPPDIIELGKAGWTILHTTAAYYPESPTQKTQKEMNNFLHSFANIFPCNICAKDFRKILKDSPPELSSRTNFSQWLCGAHNRVNVYLGKPKFDCKKVDERWLIPDSVLEKES
eukprot:TRINITY_DN982_c0_g1_i1.p1 TRINITY_DN982_c0_g1~~TRINITY_DN982_c0_g1_i1.p1  ORF type:complete len:203 (-),score=50.37 TRINITY_DN982_c0_g1_i1:21-629(-)